MRTERAWAWWEEEDEAGSYFGIYTGAVKPGKRNPSCAVCLLVWLRTSEEAAG